MIPQRFASHEQAEVTAGGGFRDDLLGWCGDEVPRREYLPGRGDVVGCAGEQIQRAADPAQVHPVSADHQFALDQFVALEQVLDQPQVEGAGDVLGVLEPVLEFVVTLDVAVVVEIVEQLKLFGDLGFRLDRDEPTQHGRSRHVATTRGDYRTVGSKPEGVGHQLGVHGDRRVIGVEIDGRARQGECVHVGGVQRRIDRGQPAPWQSPMRFTGPPMWATARAMTAT